MMEDLNLWSFVTVFVLQCIGAYLHWRFMVKQGRVNGTFFKDYLFADYPGRSVATIGLLLGASWAMAAAGAADNLNPELIWTMLLQGKINVAGVSAAIGAVGTGYAFDSRINKGSGDK